ncbi:sensor histidine kinase [Sphingomonas sp. MMS24-JH45]
MRAVVRGNSTALRRLFANLIENAVRYGDRAVVGWRVEGGSVDAWVADEGPGIDPAQAERLFQPCVRGDPSRNRATGGTGLGLAIARSIATRHGGAATLENGEKGAIARVVLPLAD